MISFCVSVLDFWNMFCRITNLKKEYSLFTQHIAGDTPKGKRELDVEETGRIQ